MNRRQIIRYFVVIVFLLMVHPLKAADCLDVFGSAVQTSGPRLTLPVFQFSASNSNQSGSSINLAAGDYRNVTVSNNGAISFTTTGATYRISRLTLRNNVTASFAPGDYFIDTFDINQGSTIQLSGTGTVRIYTNSITIDQNTNIAVGDRYLILVSYSSAEISNGVNFNGIFSINGTLIIDNNAVTTGAINVAGSFSSANNAVTNYDPSYVANADFGTMCEQNPPYSLEYIDITTDGTALTCTSETVTLRACSNVDCSSVATEDVIVTLAVTGNATWTVNPVTIPANSISGVTVDLIDRTAETVTINVASTSVATVGTSPQCSNGSCQVIFNEAGYIVSLPNHASCADSSLTLQAVRLSDNGISCAPAYSGDQSVNVSFDYSNPVTGSTIPLLDSLPLASAGNTQSRTIVFDASASASLPFRYDDAGQLTITVSDGGTNGLASSSVNSTIRPAKLRVFSNDINSSCSGPDYGSCSEFRTAGIAGDTNSEFNLTIAGACADDTITPNFALNSIALSPNLVAPALGNNGTLGINSIDIVSNGQANITQTISEVGAFTITATPGSYLGAVIPPATSDIIGRFTPHRFIVSDNSPMLEDATCDFTYQDQETGFAPGLAPEIIITAVNSEGVTTTNYGGDGIADNDFWKLNAIDYSDRAYSNLATPYPGLISTVLGAVVINGQDNYDGIHNVTFDADLITHTKAGVVPQPTNDAPFDAQVLLTLSSASLTDADGIFHDANNDASADDYESTIIDGTEIRWGRWSLENGFGSELQNIVMNLTAQYYNGTQFVPSTTDNCTSAVTTNLSNYSGSLNDGETTLSQDPINNGIIPLTLSAPGANNTGSVLVSVTTPFWMQYDFNGDNTLEDAQATATFGIFEGRRPIIIKRQSY